MEQYQLQVFAGLMVILQAAFVAMICDFVKRNGDQLRELTAELKQRREEEQHRWQSMTAEHIQALPAAAEEFSPQPTQKTAREEFPTRLPAGFLHRMVLARLLEDREQISGLVVCIGVNASQDHGDSLPASIIDVVRSLIGPEDLACQFRPEEFLLIFPRERGASAQRRLSHLAQQLWDFQLRSYGRIPILFSWGGVEVCNESIDEAVASARERMLETPRGRQLLAV